MNTLKYGQTNNYVTRLQQFLNMKGYSQPITGYFGDTTYANLKLYQKNREIQPTGIADGLFLDIVTTPDKLDAWCHAIQEREGYYAPGENSKYPSGTPAWHNNNPGNLVFANQDGATQSGRFASFKTYEDGYNALKNLLIWACTGQSHMYNPNATLLDFYKIYAPTSDGNDPSSYAEGVAKKIGVSSNVIIKTLLP